MTDLTDLLARIDPDGKLEKVREYEDAEELVVTLSERVADGVLTHEIAAAKKELADAAIKALAEVVEKLQNSQQLCIVYHDEMLFENEVVAKLEKAEAEARKWEWVAKHTYVCPLGEMKPGEPGSYVIEVRPSDALLAHYEEAHG